MRLLAVMLLCLGLAACGNVPRPFSPGAKTGGLPPPGPASALILHPVAGNEDAPLEKLTAALLAQLRKNQVAAIPYESPNRYRMVAQVDAITVNGDQAELHLLAQFSNPDLSPIVSDSWSRTVSWRAYLAADPALMNDLAREMTARMLVLMGLTEPGSAGAGADGPDLLIAPVLRAPGDGAAALVDSMTSELTRLGVMVQGLRGVADRPVLEALVTVRALDASNDLVRIAWVLKDRSGRERGRLEQQNTVPTGRLNRRWGVVAQLAASAAAPGVIDLLQRLETGG